MSAVATEEGALVGEALADLRGDFDQLLHLCRGAEARLGALEIDLAHAAPHEETRELLARQLLAARRRYRVIERRLLSLRELAVVDELAAARASLADLLRTEQALTASLCAAADWQSPSFLHSTRPAAGRQNGRVTPHWDDYKRDRHLDADAYESAYLREMVDNPAGVPLRALLTSCGMAAFATVLAALRLDGPVLAGAGLYHESKFLLRRTLPQLELVDEPELPRAIEARAPAAVFVDSLSNTKWMPAPDLAAVAERLAGSDAYLVVDNTALSVACQPFALAPGVRLIVFESLLKYAQLGMDRANAGVVVARCDEAERLATYREHLGTNISDTAVHALPSPDRGVLERRLARLGRNASILAERLRERAPVSVRVVKERGQSLFFHGGCLSIVVARGREQALVEAAITAAERQGVALLAGSSFGFDTTRIYLTAARAEHGEPFVRVAAGSEHRLEIEGVADALSAAVEEVCA